MPAGYTTVSAANIVDASGNLLASGSITFQPCNNNGQPLSFRVNSKGQSLNRPIQATITNGAFTVQLADTTLTSPENIAYSVSIRDNLTSASVLGPGYLIQPSGSTWSFDDFVPNVPALATIQTGPQGQGLNNRGAWSANTQYNNDSTAADFFAAPNGSSYVVKSTYVSGSSFGASDLANASVLAAGGLLSGSIQLKTATAVPTTYATQGATTQAQGLTTGTTANSVVADFTCFLKTPFTQAGYLSSIELYISSAVGTTVDIVLGTASGTTFTVVQRFTVTSTVVGWNTFNQGIDYPLTSVAAGDYLGFITNGTATLQYQNAAGAGFYYATSDIGATPTVLAVQTGQLAFQGSVVTLANNATTTEVQNTVNSNTQTSFNTGTITDGIIYGGTTYTNTSIIAVFMGENQVVPENSSLLQLVVGVHVAGTFDIIIGTKSGAAAFTVTNRFTVTAATAGTLTFTAGIDFPFTTINKGQYIGWISNGTASLSFETGVSGYVIYYLNPDPPGGMEIGSTTTLTVASNVLDFQAILAPVPVMVPIDAKVRNQNGNRTMLFETAFPGTTAPVGVVTAGGTWTFNNGLTSPSSGQGYGCTLTFPNDYALEKRTIRHSFQIVAVGAVVGVGAVRNTNSQTTPVLGSLVWVDSSANTLNIGNAYNGTASPGVDWSVALGFTMATGATYTLAVTVNQRVLSASITDPLTGVTASVSAGNNITDTGAAPVPGNYQDKLCLVAIAGQFTSSKVTLLGNIRRPHLYIAGDSITYGYTVELAQAWSEMLSAAAGSGIVSGRIGGTSYGLASRFLSELQILQPDTVVWLIGTNDIELGYTQAVYEANINQMIAIARAAGCKIVIGMIPPLANSAFNTTAQAWNAWLLTLSVDGFLRFDIALSISNIPADGQNTSLFQSDGIHPIPAGHEAMFNRVAADVPWLLD